MTATRPRFPFGQALVVARELSRLAEFVALQGGNRTADREALLATWKGGHADTFAATHAPTEDEARVLATTELESNADDWATQWALAVNDTNLVVREEAQVEADRLNRDRQSAWSYAIRSYHAAAHDAWVNGWVFYGTPPRQPPHIVVDPVPESATAPSGPGFWGPDAPFVAYSFDGDARMVATPVGSPPA